MNKLNFFGYKKLIETIERMSPDVILLQIGATSFPLLTALKKTNIPIIGLWTGTKYQLKDIINLGIKEIVKNYRSIYMHVISALIPSFLIKSMLELPNLKKIVVLNKNNSKKIKNFNVPKEKISVVPPGIITL